MAAELSRKRVGRGKHTKLEDHTEQIEGARVLSVAESDIDNDPWVSSHYDAWPYPTVIEEVIVPLSEVIATVTNCISTPLGSSNFYSTLEATVFQGLRLFARWQTLMRRQLARKRLTPRQWHELPIHWPLVQPAQQPVAESRLPSAQLVAELRAIRDLVRDASCPPHLDPFRAARARPHRHAENKHTWVYIIWPERPPYRPTG